MKNLLLGICCVTLLAGAAERPSLTPEQLAQKRAEMYRRTGGRIVLPRKGFVALVNCQSRADFAKATARFTETFDRLGFKAQASRQTTPFALSELSGKAKELGAGSVVFLVDDPSLPMSLVAIESRSGLVNVAALAADNPSPALLSRRAAKMVCRVGMLASGGAESESTTSMLNPVGTLKELDACEGIGNEASVMMGVIRGMFKAGVTTERRLTYRQACKLGEAMMPTNAIQQAIWDEVHSEKERGPVNGLKIAPPNAKK